MSAAGRLRTLRRPLIEAATMPMPIALAALFIVLMLGLFFVKRRKRPSARMSRAGVTLGVRRWKVDP